MGRRGPQPGSGGRPALTTDKRRTVQVQVRLTEEEARSLDASRGDDSRGGFLRRLLAEALDQPTAND